MFSAFGSRAPTLLNADVDFSTCGAQFLHTLMSQRSIIALFPLIARQSIKAGIMQNLQVLNSFCSFEIPDIFLFKTRFKK
jgi:DNA invertase Pin-like site-specific DNA recombinase